MAAINDNGLTKQLPPGITPVNEWITNPGSPMVVVTPGTQRPSADAYTVN